MKEFDIEAYLDGELNQEELAHFEQKLRRDPVFAQQVETQRKLTEHLRTQLLREQVSSVLSTPPAGVQPDRWKWGLGIAFAILLGGYFFFWAQREMAPASVPTLPLRDTSSFQPPPPQQQQRPMAQAQLPEPRYPAPRLKEDNPKLKPVLDQLWYTEFPPPGVKFSTSVTDVTALLAQRKFTAALSLLNVKESATVSNDTLRFLKGYCLLELGEGHNALRYLDRLELKQPGWQPQLQWYRGLGWLLTGDTSNALPIFREIANTPDHPLLKQGQKAVDLLQ
ncbi:MAG: hypothetical protein JNJ57_11440 [Saprospiraceae bacterium]|nr:hypothetical protein [Saprospiraceae bacterium]